MKNHAKAPFQIGMMWQYIIQDLNSFIIIGDPDEIFVKQSWTAKARIFSQRNSNFLEEDMKEVF